MVHATLMQLLASLHENFATKDPACILFLLIPVYPKMYWPCLMSKHGPCINMVMSKMILIAEWELKGLNGVCHLSEQQGRVEKTF